MKTKNALLVAIVVICIILSFVCFSLLDAAVRGSYATGSLENMQSEIKTLSTLLPSDLSPESLKASAKTWNIPFKTTTDCLSAHPPLFDIGCQYGNLTFFFDSQSNLVDIRGHLLDVSLLKSE